MMTRAVLFRRNLVTRGLMTVGAALMLVTATAPSAFADGDHVRWDIISVNFPPASPLTVSAGGIAMAKANDGSQITLTGSGTFKAPGNSQEKNATGGGAWTICP